MATIITIEVTSYKDKPISHSLHADFDEKGGTIGRAPENTLVLLDPERKISRTHATLSWSGDRLVLRDQGSLTPVLLNGRPIGNGNDSPLAPGDEIRIAGYAMTVRAAGAKAAPTPAAQKNIEVSPELLMAADDAVDATLVIHAPLQPTTPAETAAQASATPDVAQPEATEPPPDATEMSEPVLSWMSAQAHGSVETTTIILAHPTTPAEGAGEPASSADRAVPSDESSRASPEPIGAPVPPVAESAPAADRDYSNQALLDALLAGAGIRGTEVPGGLTPERMEQLGALLREATGGLLDLLAARALTKREVRADMTVIVASDNNPLKFSPDREAALTHLMVPRGRGFMPPLRAVTDAYDSLRAHQLGFMAGMRSALSVVLGRFNPRTLEERMTGATMVDSILPTHRKAKLWDLFAELYGTISKEAHTDFHALFGREFLRAYQAHVAKVPEHGDSSSRHS